MSNRPTRLPPNGLMIRLYHTPLAALLGRMFLLLTTRGRRSGLPRITPLQYESVGRDFYLGSARGLRADWVRNIQAHSQVEVRVGRRCFAALARVVTERGPTADFLELRLARHPHIVGAILIGGTAPHASRPARQYAALPCIILPHDGRARLGTSGAQGRASASGPTSRHLPHKRTDPRHRAPLQASDGICGRMRVAPAEWATWLGAAADPQQPYEHLERHLGRPIDREAFHRRRMLREGELLAAQHAAAGFSSFAGEARQSGLRLAVASSSDRAWVEGHLMRLGLRHLFSCIKCAEDVERTKPSPDLYLAVLEDLQVEPVQAVAFEDSAQGIRAAKAAGLFCVAVPNPITRYLDLGLADLQVEGFLGLEAQGVVAAANRAGAGSPLR
jgi:deazaflavin-dependent oxidoreductase (nitroreductase family)/HAD superfamily hydrolase (TIGR01509 family)